MMGEEEEERPPQTLDELIQVKTQQVIALEQQILKEEEQLTELIKQLDQNAIKKLDKPNVLAALSYIHAVILEDVGLEQWEKKYKPIAELLNDRLTELENKTKDG